MALTDNLAAYWPLNEASGSALDAHGSNDLTETSGTIAATTGKITGARDFEAGDTEYFEIADNADVSTGDVDFTITAWVRAESKDGNMVIVGKDTNTSGNREYNLFYRGTDRFSFEVFSATDSGTVLDASSFGSPSTGTWYFVVAWYDATANTMNIQVNNGTVNSTSKSTLQASGSSVFRIGARNFSGGEAYWDGLICEVGLWKRVLTSDERTELYNSGNGLSYDDFGGGGGITGDFDVIGGAGYVTCAGSPGVLLVNNGVGTVDWDGTAGTFPVDDGFGYVEIS